MADRVEARGPDGGARRALDRRLVAAHVDLDSFFVAVARRFDPSLEGRPVVVGSDGPHGAVASASYEARRLGITAGWSMRRARARCRDLVVVGVDRDRVAAASREVFDVVRREGFAPRQVSIDEAYLNLRAVRADGQGDPAWAPVRAMARLRNRVRSETGLAASIGVASADVYAKLASGRAKPDGLEVVPPGEEAVWVAPLPVRKLPGVGPQAAAALSSIGVEQVADLLTVDAALLRWAVGERTAEVWTTWARGDASGTVDAPEEPAAQTSISVERTLAADAFSIEELEPVIVELAAALSGRLVGAAVAPASVSVKVRTRSWHDASRRVEVGHAASTDAIADAIRRGLVELPVAKGIRLLGAAALRLRTGEQQVLALGASTPLARVGLAVGDRVRHTTFGTGVVLALGAEGTRVRFSDRDRWIAEQRRLERV